MSNLYTQHKIFLLSLRLSYREMRVSQKVHKSPKIKRDRVEVKESKVINDIQYELIYYYFD